MKTVKVYIKTILGKTGRMIMKYPFIEKRLRRIVGRYPRLYYYLSAAVKGQEIVIFQSKVLALSGELQKISIPIIDEGVNSNQRTPLERYYHVYEERR